MRAFKISFALTLLLGSIALAGLTYFQSHGAGISTGILLALVLVCYVYDHRRHIFGMEAPVEYDRKKTSNVRNVAVRHGRLIAMHQDGAFAPRSGR